jgi:FkbM family methyltransferase
MINFSQLQQDLIVLAIFKNKRNGYFVEFGACDGIHFSNTYLLEKEFEWTGIVAEPCKSYHAALLKNRKCHIDLRCVWNKSNIKIPFIESASNDLSTISQFQHCDHMVRVEQEKYEVETITLLDLLQTYNAPLDIDYLSIDTEGSEYSILESFDFSKYNISIITVEHNFQPVRKKYI